MKSNLLFVTLVFIALYASAQTDPSNVPVPPKEQLAKFDPFVGLWQSKMDYAGMQWDGTIEFKSAIKGWYIERTILTKTTDGKIDREFRSMITWDEQAGHFRIWRFETLPPRKINEGVIFFDGTSFVEEYQGNNSVFRNRTTLVNKDEFEITTEIEYTNGEKERIGIVKATRNSKKR